MFVRYATTYKLWTKIEFAQSALINPKRKTHNYDYIYDVGVSRLRNCQGSHGKYAPVY